LALLGIIFSTVSAQFVDPADITLSTLVPLVCAQPRRRKRHQGVDDESRPSTAASYSRYSCDNQSPKSIDDQQRPCCERAKASDHQLPKEYEFADEATSGTKVSRDGFDAMLKAAADGLFGTLYVFDLSRLARDSVLNTVTLRKLVNKFKVRVISISDGIDTSNPNWEMQAAMLGILNQQYLKNLSANVLRGQIGNVLEGRSVGDHRFGFESVVIPGSESGRRGQNQRPEKTYRILEHQADWVKRIFLWFVKDRRSIQWIVKELNRLNVPRDHRSKGKKWGRPAVINIFRCTKYIGIWTWGKLRNHHDDDTGGAYQEPRDEDEWKKWTRQFPELRIIDDDTFFKAQHLLDENNAKAAKRRDSDGTFRGPVNDSANPRHLLQNRIRCAECGAYFQVAGASGKYLGCPGARDGVCSCGTMLPRTLAAKMILEAIQGRILSNPQWRDAIHQETSKAWDAFQAEVPRELEAVEQQSRERERKISNLVALAEDGDAPADIKERLRMLRQEKDAIDRTIQKLKRRDENRPHRLTADEIDQRLQNLYGVLTESTPAAALALGALIGDVSVSQASRPGRKRPFLRGVFSLGSRRLTSSVSDATLPPNSNQAEEGVLTETIQIDFVEPDPKYELSDHVHQLYEEGHSNWEISEQLGIAPSRVTLLDRLWYERQGLPFRSRETRAKRKSRTTPHYHRIAEEAKRLFDSGLSLCEIGRRFDTTENTARRAIDVWHIERNLPTPNFSERRQALMNRAADLYDAGKKYQEIAVELDCCVATVSNLLRDWSASRGENRADGRALRHRRKRPA
jgi:DNA invertase Pin-like site-specific DNA recombinase